MSTQTEIENQLGSAYGRAATQIGESVSPGGKLIGAGILPVDLPHYISYDTGKGTAVVYTDGNGNFSIVDQPNAGAVSTGTGTTAGETQGSVDSQIRAALTAAAKANPLVAKAINAAVQVGLPANMFVSLLNAESGFNPNALSPAGAAGIAQIMPADAQAAGIDPNNPDQALQYAAHRLANALSKYGGDWPKTLASYYAGEGAVDAAGGVPDFPAKPGVPTPAQYVSIISGNANDPLSFAALEAKGLAGGTTRTSAQEAASAASALSSQANAMYKNAQTAQLLGGGSPDQQATARYKNAQTAQLLAGGTPEQQALALKTLQDMLPKQQLLLQQAQQTTDYIHGELVAGRMTTDQATAMADQVQQYVTAGMAGATPFDEFKQQQLVQKDQADQARLLLDQRVSSESTMADSLMSSYKDMLTGTHPLLTNPGAAWDPFMEAKNTVEQAQGGPQLGDQANALLQSFLNPQPTLPGQSAGATPETWSPAGAPVPPATGPAPTDQAAASTPEAWTPQQSDQQPVGATA